MTISKKLFGKSYSALQWVETAGGILVSAVTIFRTLSPKNALSVVSNGVVVSQPNWWMLFLGIIILTLTILLIKERKRR